MSLKLITAWQLRLRTDTGTGLFAEKPLVTAVRYGS
jgi:hypothetical protein